MASQYEVIDRPVLKYKRFFFKSGVDGLLSYKFLRRQVRILNEYCKIDNDMMDLNKGSFISWESVIQGVSFDDGQERDNFLYQSYLVNLFLQKMGETTFNEMGQLLHVNQRTVESFYYKMVKLERFPQPFCISLGIGITLSQLLQPKQLNRLIHLLKIIDIKYDFYVPKSPRNLFWE